MMIVGTIIVYFAVLMLLSRWTARRSDNDTFYRGNRQSKWYLVAFGMVGASISGVTFISVPGMVLKMDMTYIQTCLGFILGYVAVAFILLPVYYRWNMTTIYSYLQRRLGNKAHKTGASFFLLSKMTGAAVRFYVVCILLHRFVVTPLWPGFTSFVVTVLVMTALIWLYTRRGGIKTLVWTDTFQTTCMFTALLLIIWQVMGALEMNVGEAVQAIAGDTHSRMFVMDDWLSRQNFWKQFLSGVFIVIVMTGLDQDMMQKNLTCKSLREAQKDMCSYGFAFVPANLLFMALGVLLVLLAQKEGMALPENGDDLLPMFAATGRLGEVVVTTYCVDIKERAGDEQLRKRVHVGMAVVFMLIILMVDAVNSTSVIDFIYILCSYTYGPLLGLFAFGLLTKRKIGHDKVVPYIAVASPLICYALNVIVAKTTGYQFGYELLMLNGLLTFCGLWLTSGSNDRSASRSASC